jgi:hypothetical protein
VKVAGHLVILRSPRGTALHLAERSDTSVAVCGTKVREQQILADSGGRVYLEPTPWIPGFGACAKCRRIVGAEGYTHVVEEDGAKAEL